MLFWTVVGTNVEGRMGGKVVELGEGKRREGRVLWCAVMGDWERGGEGGEGVVYWDLLLCEG